MRVHIFGIEYIHSHFERKKAKVKIYIRGVGYYVPIEFEYKHLVKGEYIQIQDGRIFQMVSEEPAYFELVEKENVKEGVRIALFKFWK